MKRAATALPAAMIVVFAACSRGARPPEQLDTRNDLCASCRMPVSDPHLAGQIVAPGEEPRFFDDLACLRERLARQPRLPHGAALYVADHRTGAWVPADRALYTLCPAVSTPMSSHLLAHADAASRDGDPATQGGTTVTMGEALGPSVSPGGGKGPAPATGGNAS
jgi:copper chaperone NosL